MSSPTGPSVTDFYSGIGITQAAAPKPIIAQRAPVSSDLGYAIGQLWVDQPSDAIYGHVESAAGSATWVALGGGTLQIEDIAGDSGTAVPVSGTVTIAGGTGIVTAASGSTLTINGVGGGYESTVVTADTSMAVNRSYIANKAGTAAVMTLPAAAAVGDSVRVSGLGATGYSIAQNAGQTISMNATSSTTGVGGSAAPTSRYQTMEILCVIANTNFVITYSTDAVTIV